MGGLKDESVASERPRRGSVVLPQGSTKGSVVAITLAAAEYLPGW